LCTLRGYRLFSEKICNEYAAQTMFFQSQAFLTEKSQILSGFFDFQKLATLLILNFWCCLELAAAKLHLCFVINGNVSWNRTFPMVTAVVLQCCQMLCFSPHWAILFFLAGKICVWRVADFLAISEIFRRKIWRIFV